MNEKHKMLIDALRSREFDSLLIRKRGNTCFFVIGIGGTPHAYLNKFGEIPHYRHVWQIHHWLRENFEIDPRNRSSG
jgi:hypothetical protein